jgi:hypothetical protein
VKIIERYLSAYVVGCLYGFTEEKHRDYVFEVLRETGSRVQHPVLGKVLDYIRQSDPADPNTQEEVRAYCVAMLANPVEYAPVPEYEARYSLHRGLMVITLTHQGSHVGFALAKAEQKEEAIKELQERFPGIRVVQE